MVAHFSLMYSDKLSHALNRVTFRVVLSDISLVPFIIICDYMNVLQHILHASSLFPDNYVGPICVCAFSPWCIVHELRQQTHKYKYLSGERNR